MLDRKPELRRYLPPIFLSFIFLSFFRVFGVFRGFPSYLGLIRLSVAVQTAAAGVLDHGDTDLGEAGRSMLRTGESITVVSSNAGGRHTECACYFSCPSY